MKRHLQVLIVEDSTDDAELLLRQFQRGGYAVEHARAESEDEMRALLRERRWDAIVCDYNLPRFGALNALAVYGELGEDVPFIIVSGTVGEEMAVEALKAGAHDFILKGNLSRLIPALERELREATVRRERRQALEDLKHAIEVRDEFLTIASHELKTPITALALILQRSLDMLRGRNLFEVSLDALETKLAHAIRQADRLTVLINHLLDVTRFASGRLAIAPHAVDLADVVRNVVSNIPASLRGTSELRINGLSSLVGNWDPAGLDMILSHLILNATKFGEGKPIEISVERSGDRARVRVTDRGIGIASEDQARIFERFGRAVPSRHYGGFGLGLWITKRIAEAHGGTVDVSSRPGEGASFRVELPMVVDKSG